MWKDFFYYSKSERRAVYVLLTLIALLLIITFISSRRDPQNFEPIAGTTAQTDSFLSENRMIKNRQVTGMTTADRNKPRTRELFAFDPNSADSIELSRLGLSPFVVRNVMKYRQKGGRFTTAASFSRVYGLTDKQFAALEPYILIPEHRKPVASSSSAVRPVDSVKIERRKPVTMKYPEGTLVDVNVADTVELKKIPRVGSVIARNIVAYRERLGGFHALEQLLEVRFVTPELLKWFTIGDTPVRKLALNKAGLDKLRAHPYLNFYQAKVIMEYRRKKGKIKSLSQLSLYEEFTEKDLIRLSAYVSFD